MFKKRLLYTVSILLVLAVAAFAAVGCGGGAEEGSGSESESVTGKIIGIDPGAGIMSTTEKAIEEYGLNFELIEGSGATMTASLKNAIENEKWIVVTGWTPHWKFARWDLKYLEDPKGLYGETEYISTIARKGLSEEMPKAYEFLDNFNWTPDDMGEVMIMNEESQDPYENAKTWVNENMDKVGEWLPEEPYGEGSIKLGYVEWSSEVASTNVVAAVLQEVMGYDVETVPVSAAAMWEGVASGELDAMVAAWLPTTHGHYLEKVEAEVDNLGKNLEGTRIGLVVPEYVTINSIEELNEAAEKFSDF